jgi:hypothetical protein
MQLGSVLDPLIVAARRPDGQLVFAVSLHLRFLQQLGTGTCHAIVGRRVSRQRGPSSLFNEFGPFPRARPLQFNQLCRRIRLLLEPLHADGSQDVHSCRFRRFFGFSVGRSARHPSPQENPMTASAKAPITAPKHAGLTSGGTFMCFPVLVMSQLCSGSVDAVGADPRPVTPSASDHAKR